MKKVISLSLAMVLGSVCYNADAATRKFNFDALKAMSAEGRIPSTAAQQIMAIPGIESQVSSDTIKKAASIGAGNYFVATEADENWTTYKGFADNVTLFAHLLVRVPSATPKMDQALLPAYGGVAGVAADGAASLTFSWALIQTYTLGGTDALSTLTFDQALNRMYAFDYTSGKFLGEEPVTNLQRLYLMGVCLGVMNSLGIPDTGVNAAAVTQDDHLIGTIGGNNLVAPWNYTAEGETAPTAAQKLKAARILDKIAATLE